MVATGFKCELSGIPSPLLEDEKDGACLIGGSCRTGPTPRLARGVPVTPRFDPRPVPRDQADAQMMQGIKGLPAEPPSGRGPSRADGGHVGLRRREYPALAAPPASGADYTQ